MSMRLLASLGFAMLFSVSQAETIRLRADVWLPFNGEPGAAVPGYAIEIAKAICDKNAVTLDYQNMPWEAALKAAATGEIDAVVGCNKKEAASLVTPKASIGEPRVALVVKKGSTWKYGNVAGLEKIRLAVTLGYSYWPLLDDYIEKTEAPKVTKFEGDHPLVDEINKLLAGEVDVLAEVATVFSWTVKQEGYSASDFRIAYLHEGEPVYFAFSPPNGGSKFAKMFDDGINELRQSGKLAEILKRYDLSDWEQR